MKKLIIMALMLFLLSLGVEAAHNDTSFTYNRFECPVQNTGETIGYVTIIGVMIALWMYILITKIPLLNIVFGLVFAFFAWQVAACFFFANVLFIFMAIISILFGIMFSFKSPIG